MIRPLGVVILSLLATGILPAQQQYTTGYQPHARPEAPGTLLYRSPTPALGGRLTNIIYHQGWLMTGFENPGSNANTNDLRFRVMDVSNLENDPVPVPFWPSDFGLNYGTNNQGREHWYSGNWGYNTHGHGRTATHVHWPVLNVPDFGGAVFKGIVPDEVRFNYGWQGNSNSGRLRRQLPWNANQDWAYGSNNSSTIYLEKAWRDNPTGSWNSGNYTMKSIAKVAGGNLGVRGFPEMLGDKFFINSDQRMSGMAIYQVPDDRLEDYDPADPVPDLQLLGASTEAFGGYWPEFWASSDGRLYSVGAVSGEILVMDLTDFSDPKIIRRFSDRGDGKGIRVRNAQYPKFQDDHLLIEKYVIDMEQLVAGATDPVVLELDAPPPTSAWRQGFDPSQFSFPLGNLIVTGGYGEDSGGLFIHVRQQAPDTTPPTVRYHIPEADRTNYSRFMPINVIIHEELDSRTLHNGVNFMIREVVDGEPAGDPVDAIFNLGSNNVMTLTPVEPLAADTTYQVDFPSENGVMDISGNRIVDYSWRFSTGSLVDPVQPLPTIDSFAVDTLKAGPGDTFTVTATVEDGGPFEYRIDLGDGSGFGAWTPLAAGSHDLEFTPNYGNIGRYDIRFQVQDDHQLPENEAASLLVYEAPAGPAPTRSSPIIVASDGRVWVVNPDADTVSVLDQDGTKLGEYPVGADPRGIAEDANGLLWVTCFDGDEIHRLDSTGAPVDVIDLDYGTSPFAAAPSPDGLTMYVSAYGSGGLYRFDVASPATPDFIPLGHSARAIAVKGDHSRVYVTRFLSPRFHGEVWSIDPTTDTVETIRVEYDETPDGNNSGSGVANYLNGIAISPDNDTAVVVGKKDNTFRGLLFGNGAMTHENTVRTTVAVLDLASGSEVVAARRDLDNADSPTAVDFSPDGTMLFITVQGNNQVQAIDAIDLTAAVGATEVPVLKNTGNASETDPTGLAPQGLAIDATSRRLFTHNFMSRSATVFDMTEAFDENRFNFEQVVETVTVASESLDPQVLLGKQVFYNASDPRMAAESYISCATCHADGGHDGRDWDFTNRGEGLRNTTDLRGRSGMGHGNVHWSANFDEIQDFELDIVNHFNGEGFIDDASGPNPSLGAPNGGRSALLDALADYVTSLDESSLRRSPHRQPDGSHSPAALAGAEVFVELDCISCHRPDRGFTDSTLGAANLHDVGTLRGSSGQRLGSTLPGIDTPTLLGVWDAPPYLHDGSATTLAEVFEVVGGANHEAENGILAGGAILATSAGPGGTDYGRSAFDDFVLLGGAGHAVEFDVVDGGPGGDGILELRVRASAAANLAVTVNGVPHPLAVPAGEGPHAWTRLRIDPVALDPGATNSVVVSNFGPEPVALDGIVAGNATDLAAAYPHRRVLASDETDRLNLLAFLLEIDREWSGPELFPSPPSELAALAVSESLIRFMFVDGTSLETGYLVQHREAGGSWQETPHALVPGAGTSVFLDFPGLVQGTDYEFRVAAMTGATTTAWSDVVTATPLVAPGNDPVVIAPLHDAYLENGTRQNDDYVKLEDGSRIGYLMFSIPDPGAELLSATLRFTVVADGNNRGGLFRITEGTHSNWTETTLTAANAPALSANQLAEVDGNRAVGQTYDVALTGLQPGVRSLVLQKIQGGDFWISSKEGGQGPQLILQYADGAVTPPDGPAITIQPADTAVAYGATLQLGVTAQARPEAAYRWYRDGVALTDGGGTSGATTATLTVSPAGATTAASYTVMVEDLAGSVMSDPATVTVTGTPPLEQWRVDEFPDSLDEVLVSGDGADPDFDGLTNLLEFLQALDPHASQPELHPKMVSEPGGMAYEFRVRDELGAVSFQVKVSTDLASWDPVDSEDFDEISNVDGVRTIRVRHATPPDGRIYYKLESP